MVLRRVQLVDVSLAHAAVVGVDPLVHHDPDQRVLAQQHPPGGGGAPGGGAASHSHEAPALDAVLPPGDGVRVALALLLKARRRARHAEVGGLVEREGPCSPRLVRDI